MSTITEKPSFRDHLGNFFQARVDTPLRFARVLVGGTLGLIFFALGAPAIIFLLIQQMAGLDWFFNSFIILLIITHFSIVHRKTIASAWKAADGTPKEVSKRVEPKVAKPDLPSNLMD